MPPEPLTRGLPHPRSPFCPPSSTEFVEPPPPKKIPGYATAYQHLCKVGMTVALRRGTDFQQVPNDPLCGARFHNAVVRVFLVALSRLAAWWVVRNVWLPSVFIRVIHEVTAHL